MTRNYHHSPDGFDSIPPKPGGESVTFPHLQHWLDQRNLDAAVEEFPDLSAEERTAIELARRIFREIPHLPQKPVPEGFSDRVLAAVLDAHERRRAWRRRVATIAALAASLLLLVYVGRPTLRTQPTQPAMPQELPTLELAQHPEPVPQLPSGQETAPPPKVVETWAEARTALVRLSRRTADEAANETVALLPNWPSEPIRPILDPIPPMLPGVDPLADVSSGAILSLSPVTNSAKRAVERFRKDLGAFGAELPNF